MGDHDAAHPLLKGGAGDDLDLGGAEVAGRQGHVVLGDDPQHLAGDLADPALLVERLDGVGSHAVGAQLVLELGPHRGRGALGHRGGTRALVGAVDGGQPHHLGAAAAGDVDGDGVEPADRAVERDGSDRMAGGHGGVDHRGALGRGDVVRLQHESGQADLGEAGSQGEILDAPPHHVGGDVDVGVVGPLDQLPRPW